MNLKIELSESIGETRVNPWLAELKLCSSVSEIGEKDARSTIVCLYLETIFQVSVIIERDLSNSLEIFVVKTNFKK